VEALVATIIQALVTVGMTIYQAVSSGDDSILDKPLRELLPTPLKTELAKVAAEAAAAQKFGPRP
jgi:hypothetical protein